MKKIKRFDKDGGKMIERICKGTLNNIAKDLESVETHILDIIKLDLTLQRLFQISTSVSGIGTVTVVEVIIATNEFKNITTAKKFACYSRIVPFEHNSGKSIWGARVSHKANIRGKTLLNMAAMAS